MITKLSNKNKILIISHAADVDGMGSVILGKVHFGDIDYCLVEFSELESALEQLLRTGKYKQYDEIYITDVSLRTNAITLIDKNEELKKRIRHFDHHPSEMDASKKYPFINEVIRDENGIAVCGTTLFYKHIEKDFKFKSEYLDKFLEGVRSHDTLGPLGSTPYGNDLTTLLGFISREDFIDKFASGIKEKKDPFTRSDKMIVDGEDQRVKAYIEECDKNLLVIDLDGHRVGVSISESYRSSVGAELSLRHDDLDYILIINFMRNQFSFRTTKEGVDCGSIAKGFTREGGGHPKAAGMPINKNTVFILDLVKQAILDKEKAMKLTQNKNQS